MKRHLGLMSPFETLSIDVRHAVRRLRRRPALTLLAIVLFGLGIGLNVGLFSVADAVLLGPLPFDDAEDLYAVWPARNFNKQMVDRASADLESWQGVAAYAHWAFPVAVGQGNAQQVPAAVVSTDFFELLGVRAWRGGLFEEEHSESGANVVVVSYEFWNSQLHSDENAVGGLLRVDGVDRLILGVLPPDSRLLGRVDHVWTPYSIDRASRDYVSSFYLRAVGRLAPGVGPAAAVEELKAFSIRLEEIDAQIYSPPDFVWPPVVEPLRDALYGSSSGLLQVLALATGAVLLLVCANVSHLLLVHAESRSDEFVLLSALGAGRLRIARTLLMETLLLALAGGGLGCLVVVWSRSVLLRWLPENLPRHADLALDGRALAVSMGLALAVTLLAVLLPARRVLSPGGALGDGSSGSRLRGSRGVAAGMGGAQRLLVTLEVAAVLTLVMTAVLLGRSLQALVEVDPGVNARGAVTLRVHAPSEGRTEDQRTDLLASIVRRVQTLPGVRSAGAVQLLPLSGEGNWSFPYLAEGMPTPDGPLPTANFRVVTPGYADAAGLPILAGRDFDARDHQDAPAVGWVNRKLADQLWPGEPAIGKTMLLFGTREFTVVGVVADVHQLGLRIEPQPAMYRPFDQHHVSSLFLVARTDGTPLDAVPSIRSVVAGLASDVALSDIRTFDEVLHRSVSTPRFVARLTTTFAGLAFFLGFCGILAVLAQVVEARRRGEIGVRLALGADGRRIEADDASQLPLEPGGGGRGCSASRPGAGRPAGGCGASSSRS